MKIINNACASNFISYIKLPEFRSLNDQQKIILEIALCALGILALFLAIKRCCCMKAKVESKKLDEDRGKESLEISSIPENVVNNEILDDGILFEQPINAIDEESGLPEEVEQSINVAVDESELAATIEPNDKADKHEKPIKEKQTAKTHPPEGKKYPKREFRQKESEDDIFKQNPDPNDTSNDAPSRFVKDRFGRLTKEISAGRLFSSVTEEERIGLSLFEITALAIADRANRLPQPPDNSDPDAVNESEWD